METDLTPQERTDYYRWEFAKWYATGYPIWHCPGATSIATNRRALWVCSACGDDVSVKTFLFYKASHNME